MTSVSIVVMDEVKDQMKSLSWVNWSDIAREEAMKKDIFERFMKTRKVTDEDWEFCESIDWHPVDWLPMKKSFIADVERAKKQKPIKFEHLSDLLK